MTDGSNTIFEGHFEKNELVITRQHNIYEKNQNGIRKGVYNLNEIEFAQGHLLANVWQTNDIYELNMEQDSIER